MAEITPETEHIYRFLEHLGVEADVQIDSRAQAYIVMADEHFEQNRKQVLTWFVLVSQRDGYSTLYERQRGTGQTLT
jgi:hypothetical protein